MKLFTKSIEPDTKIGVAERTAYMLGNAGTAFINTIIATFLMYFYTDVMFLNPGIIGIILLASRIFDGITDILMGMVVDRTYSKHGKARVWIIRTCIPFAISGILLVCVPASSVEILQYIYVLITYNLCNAFCLTALYVPYNTMTVNMTTNPYERGILGVFVLLGAVIGTLAVQSTVDGATKALGGDQRAWQIVISIYALLGLILHIICYIGTRERAIEEKKEHSISVKEEIHTLFGNKYWILALVTTLVVMFFTNFTGGAGIYFAKGVLSDSAYYAQFANYFSILQIIALFIAFIPMKMLGKRNTLILGLFIMLVGLIIQSVAGTSLMILNICSIFKGIGGGLSAAVFYGLVADTIDYGEWKTGIKAEGVGMAALTFVTKISSGLTGAIIGWINKICEYDPQAQVQSATAIFGLKICFTYIPLFCILIALVFMFFYSLDKQYPAIQEELHARRNKLSHMKG